MTLSPGSTVGPYEIVSLLGAGGMGQVWRARDSRLDRGVAIKVLSVELAANTQLRLRFEREAKTISQLEHPNICRLYDVGESNAAADRFSYLVMELIDGESLSARIARGPLPLPDVLRYGAEIAEALAAAHRAGIVHRDLKPGNVMITKSGAKLLDFGLAKTLQAAPSVSADSETVNVGDVSHREPLTERGAILGTFQYMSPEQLEGAETDFRSDIFALGCLLYEMLTGRRAFEGKTRTSLVAAIVAADPRPLKELMPMTPTALEHVVATCLEKDPDRRWQSAHDVAQELRWIATSREERDGNHSRRNRTIALLVAGSLLAGIAAGVLTMRMRRPHAIDQPVLAAIIPPDGVEFERPSGGGEAAVLSPDGQRVVFTGRAGDGKVLLWVRRVDEADSRSILGTEGARYPFWSPDGKSVAFFAAGKLKRVDLNGGAPVTICDVASNPLSGDWSEDGVILFSPASGAPLHQVPASGGTSTPVTALDTKAKETTHRWARFLPDGKSFLFIAASHEVPETSEVNAIYAARLGSTERKLIIRSGFNFEVVGDRLLYVHGDTLVAQRFDAEKLELQGESVPLWKVHLFPMSFGAAFSVSANDDLVYVPATKATEHELVWLDHQGKELAKITPRGFLGPWSLSPDAKRLALTIIDRTVGSDLWLKDLQRDALTRLTLDGSAGVPVWSPDGKRIAYSGPDRDIWVRPVDRDTPAEVLWGLDVWGSPSHWSADGRYIAFWTFDTKNANEYDAWILPLQGAKRPIPLANTTAAEFPLQFSPDGRWILYTSTASGRSELYVVSLPNLDRKRQVSVAGAVTATWRSASEIWYREPGGAWVAATLEERGEEIEISAPRPLFHDASVAEVAVAGERVIAFRTLGETAPAQMLLASNWRARLPDDH